MNRKEIEIYDPNNLLPLSDDLQIACFGIPVSEELDDYINVFGYIAQAFKGDIDFGFIDSEISKTDLEIISNSIINSDLVFFILIANSDNNDVFDFERYHDVFRDLSNGKKIVFISNIGSVVDKIQSDIKITIKDSTEDSLASVIINILGKDSEDYLPRN
jgi:uncharacterized protein YlzI (FlbEa/FlbD family)